MSKVQRDKPPAHVSIQNVHVHVGSYLVHALPLASEICLRLAALPAPWPTPFHNLPSPFMTC